MSHLGELREVSGGSWIYSLTMVAIWLAASTCPIEAQYESHYAGAGGGDERPKVQLGIRLKIPAIKFELPRFNMPKITVSAKIRQPDRPRVINLPEINLDTRSQQQVNGGYSRDGAAQEQTFSFSSQQEEEERPHRHYQDIQQQRHHEEQQAAYASNELLARQPPGGHGGLKLSSPLYIRPQDRQQPIEAYGRVPIKAMAFHHPDGRGLHQGELSEVLVDGRRLAAAAAATNGHRFYPITD